MPTRRKNLVIITKKENLPNSGLAVPADHRMKIKESKSIKKKS